MAEPILPKASTVKRKYRKGTFVSRFVRCVFDNKNIRKVFAANFAVVTIATSVFIPQTTSVQAESTSDMVIETQTNLTTQKGMNYPVSSIKINQNYGFFHPGIDFGGTTSDSIFAVTSGVVAYAGRDYSGYGNLVVLQHRNGLDSYYAHLSKIEVVTGQTVEMGTEIGKMGATGRATGVHLHLEIHQNGVSLNPLTILSK